MGWIRRREQRTPQPSPRHPRDPVLAAYFGGGFETSSGVSVTPDSALRLGAVYACVRVLGETIAALPLHVYRRTERGKERAEDHPLYGLLHVQPNRWQTSFEWRETSVAHTALRGVSYSRVVMDGGGKIVELQPLHPDRVSWSWESDSRALYRYQPERGPTIYLNTDELLILPALMTDLQRPLSPIGLHRETIGLSMGRREYQARFFGNSAVPKGGIKFPNQLSPEAADKVRNSWNVKHQGPENAQRIAIFDGGMEWVNIGMTNEDAQYVELEQMSITDIARIFRVPPHKIADLTRSTNNNIEHQAIEFVTDTILPWVRRWEERLNLTLLGVEERRSYFVGFDLKGLLRGDAAARANFYRTLFFLGSLAPNDIRRLEDMDTLALPEADLTFVQSNMVALQGVLSQPAAGAPAAAVQEDPERLRDLVREILGEGNGRTGLNGTAVGRH